MKKVTMSMLLAIAVSFGLAFAQPTKTQSQSGKSQSQQSQMGSEEAGWQKIGERTIDLEKDKDEFTLNRAEKYSAIKLKMKDKPVNLTDMEVHFDNGTKQDASFSTPIKALGESEVINLSSKDQNLKKVVFEYDNKNQSVKEGKAVVEIWAKKDDSKMDQQRSTGGTQSTQPGSERSMGKDTSKHSKGGSQTFGSGTQKSSEDLEESDDPDMSGSGTSTQQKRQGGSQSTTGSGTYGSGSSSKHGEGGAQSTDPNYKDQKKGEWDSPSSPSQSGTLSGQDTSKKYGTDKSKRSSSQSTPGSGTYDPNRSTQPGTSGSGTYDPNKSTQPGTSGSGTYDPNKSTQPGTSGSGTYDPNKSTQPGTSGSGTYDPNKSTQPGTSGSGTYDSKKSQSGTMSDTSNKKRGGTQSTGTSSTMGTGTSSTMSTEAGWEKIGERKIDLGKDKDEFTLRRVDRYDAIKLKVMDKSVNMTDIKVEFDNGKKQDATFTTPIKAHGESEVIHLTGHNNDNLKKIVFEYDNKSQMEKEGEATVEIWAKKSSDKGGSQSIDKNRDDKKSDKRTLNSKSPSDDDVYMDKKDEKDKDNTKNR